MEPKLRTTNQDLGKMEPFIADIWNRRSTVHPLPQINHYADGYINTESGVISIRNEICKSLKKIEEAAAEFDPKYARKNSLTAQEYITWLKDQEGITIPIDAAQAYIDFYNNARYGPHSVEFTAEDYTFFNTHFNKLMSGIPPPNEQAPLTPATTILQRRQKSLNH